jgi:hypothetical protein
MLIAHTVLPAHNKHTTLEYNSQGKNYSFRLVLNTNNGSTLYPNDDNPAQIVSMNNFRPTQKCQKKLYVDDKKRKTLDKYFILFN